MDNLTAEKNKITDYILAQGPKAIKNTLDEVHPSVRSEVKQLKEILKKSNARHGNLLSKNPVDSQEDLARALTLKTNETCDTHVTFPFNFVTMYGADGITPLGQFKIKVNPSKEVSCLYRIDGLVPWESSLTTKDRIISLLQNNPSPSQPIMVDLDKLSEYMVTIEFLNKLFKGWNIPTYVTAEGEVKYTGNGNDSKIIDKQKNDGEFNPSQYQRLYNSIEGLNNVLLEKPEGLITALK